ncbi:MAG: toll/interleukin-1 receptor domain-containing protein [Desulfobacterales bacterium]|nr:toll/interleukin-1 receptor domain-containing protein [Desulfobacterales bacterium]
MANKKHLEIIKQGVDVWNKWRKDNPDVKPDLQGANLQIANLQGADLQGADLLVANLQGANLQRANLQGADLQGANLQKADLLVANLQGANFQKANLQGADLWGANLQKADLTEADFEGANLERADLQLANIERIYLQDANLKFLRINSESLSHIPENIRQQYGKTWLVTSQVRKENTEKLIIRSIEFPPEYHQAGISILNYFSTVLRKKYPDVKATVQIKQEGLKVTMTIDPVEGDREIIEKALDEYGLVVTGKMPPEEYTDDRLLIVELKSQLRIAQSQVETQRELLELTEKGHNQRIKSIEEEVHWLRNTVGQAIQYQHEHLRNKDSEAKDQPEGAKVFISCAEDDILTANKIYADLQKKGIIPWTHKDINAGEKTKFAVKKAMEESDYFLALLSTSSVNERGAFQKELKQAFDILTEFPQDGIFIIPVRLEDCNTNNAALSDLHIIDMHKTAWNSGLDKILQALQQR